MIQMLYTSRLAAGRDFGVVKQIVDVARERNPASGISGALLFDGEHFCQLLEGPEDPVRALMARIERDERHVDVRILHDAPSPNGRLMARWQSGYSEACELEVFNGPGAPQGAPALGAFASLLRAADLE
jgi:Sensors of blue-light using FAD